MNNVCELSLLRGLLLDPLFRGVMEGETHTGEFMSELFSRGAECALARCVQELVLYDENPFSRACAGEGAPSPYLERAFSRDLELVLRALKAVQPNDMFCMGEAHPLFFEKDVCGALKNFYRENGYGDFARYRAFRYTNGMLQPLRRPSAVTLSDLKGYEREKAEVKDNFENFVRGLPFSDLLLYGDRGTGKSSTVHAMVNLFAPQKLRLVEIAKEDLLFLPDLKARLAEEPMKFVVFIDDFSLAEDDTRVSTLKAALQGSMEGITNNVMIVATSNRRHIVEENFDTRRNSVHASDSEEELLSLSDRFGRTVLFSRTGKEEYLAIVLALADDHALATSRDELSALAERWALYGGGRSPRRARQFIDFCIACEAKGVPVEV